MRIGFFSTLAFLVGSGLALAQPPAQTPMTGKPSQTFPPAQTPPPGNGYSTPPANGSTLPPFSPGNSSQVGYANDCNIGPILPDIRPSYRLYANGEFLLWRINNANLPSVSASAPVGVLHFTGTDVFNPGNPPPGVLPPNTVRTLDVPVLIQVNRQDAEGPQTNLGDHTGARFTLGAYLDRDHNWGVESSFFYLPTRTQFFNNTTGLAPDLINFNTGLTNNQFLVTGGTPGAQAGIQPQTLLLSSVPVLFVRQTAATLTGSYNSKMWGGEVNGRNTYAFVGPVELGCLIGFRYANLQEGVSLIDNITMTKPPLIVDQNADLPATINFLTVDSIRTRNQFYGAQAGLDFDWQAGPVFLSGRTKIAIGANRQSADVIGFTASTTSGVTKGGLLSSPLDGGHFVRNRFSAIPEFNLKAGVQLTSWARLYVGYDVFYFANVIRPGDQTGIATTTTQVNIAGAAQSTINVQQPTFRFNDGNVWVQGINVGLELRY